MVGTIIAQTALISLAAGATLQGRAFALGAGQVTLDNNQITVPTCAVPASTGGNARIARLIPLINILKVPTPLVLI